MPQHTYYNPRLVSLTSYIIMAVVVIDQWSKRWATAALTTDPRSVMAGLNLDLSVNHGISLTFGGYDFSGLVMVAITIVGLTVFFMLSRWRLQTNSVLVTFGIGLIMGGIVSNLSDCLRFGYILDFIDFHSGSFHWPSLNPGDCAILIGTIALLLDARISELRAEEPKKTI